MVGSVATNDLMVFTGNANPELARAIVSHLDIPIGIASVGEFSDGEISVEIGENVRGKDVFIIQARLVESGHRGDPVFRICAPGQASALATRTDHRQGSG